MENFIGARSGVQKTTKSFGRVMGKGGMGSEQQCANFLGGIPVGGLTRFGGGQLGSDSLKRTLKKYDSVRDSLGLRMTTAYCS